MKIIDAHFHLFPDSPYMQERLREVGHDGGEPELLSCWEQLDIVHGVMMSNGPLDVECHRHDPRVSYCIGLDSGCLAEYPDPADAMALVEENLKQPRCVGIKLYPGYNYQYISDAMYTPCYELARKYGKPVAVHMGQTAGSRAKLKYSHPLTLDEVAADWPDVQFVMCHFGNPFLADAAAVLEKNPNVCADLSGLLDGVTDLGRYFDEQSDYVRQLRGWISYVNDWDRFLFGTDFPAVNVPNYVEFVRRLVPEAHRQAVFFDNANRVYQLGLRV
jgi:uncharacterized protein